MLHAAFKNQIDWLTPFKEIRQAKMPLVLETHHICDGSILIIFKAILFPNACHFWVLAQKPELGPFLGAALKIKDNSSHNLLVAFYLSFNSPVNYI